MGRNDSTIAVTLLLRFTLRHWWASAGTYATLVLIVALGVAAFVGIRQASRAAAVNFGLFTEAVSGRSDFLIERAGGAIDERQLFALRELKRSLDWHLLPVIEGTAVLAGERQTNEPVFRIIGLDLMAVTNVPEFIAAGFSFAGEGAGGWSGSLGSDGGVWISPQAATAHGAVPGSRLLLASGGQLREVLVAGVVEGGREWPADLIVADIPAVQAILGREGELDRVEVLVADPALRRQTALLRDIEQRLHQALPAGLLLRAAEERLAERAGMTAAFRLNLTILSLIAMVVGAYLILQALDAAVVRRRGEIATLRSLGVPARTLFGVFLTEALWVGVLGAFAGLFLGQFFASASVHLLAETVNTLYFASAVEAIQTTTADRASAIVLGIGFSLLAGLLPARDAMLTPPAQILARGDWSPGFVWLRKPFYAVALAIAGILALAWPPIVTGAGSSLPVGGFAAAGCWIFAAALAGGQGLRGLAKVADWAGLGAAWAPLRVAVGRLRDTSSRHRLAAAGLVVAVGMVTGMVQLTGSFRGTLERWFEVRFQADLYISERGVGGAGERNDINAAVVGQLLSDPAVAQADPFYALQVPGPRGLTVLAGVETTLWTAGPVRQIWLREPGTLAVVAGAEPALVSEAFARRFGVFNGGVVELQAPAGTRQVSPSGIFADYGNEFGTAVIDLSVWREWTGRDRPLNLSLFLTPGSDVAAVRDRLRRDFPGLDVRDGAELRQLALGLFNDTFRVTRALNGIGLAVAFVGLVLALFAIFQESRETWQTLRYLGMPRRARWLAAGLEGAGIAFAAWVVGTLLGMVLGWLLIHVINVQSFGWTLVHEWRLANLLLLGLLLTLAGFAGGKLAALWRGSSVLGK